MVLFLAGCLSGQIEVWMRTEQQTVTFVSDGVSIRAKGQGWYDDWHPLQTLDNQQTVYPEYQLIASGENKHESYYHLFIDALFVDLNGVPINDVLEPIALNAPLQKRHSIIYVDSIVLDAPNGTSFYLTDATVHSLK